MKETIAKLVDLQKADNRSVELKRHHDELEGGLAGAKRGVEAAKGDLDLAHKALLEAKAHAHRKEMDVKEREDHIRDLNGKLNTATSNKEYQGIVLKIGEIKIDIGRIEEEVLVAMEEIEAKDRLHEAAKAKVKDAEAALKAAEAKVASERSALEQQIGDADRDRETIRASVPPEALRIYERIRTGNKKSGTAVAAVHGEYCQGCQMAITPQELTELVKGAKIVLCRTCQRILVLET